MSRLVRLAALGWRLTGWAAVATTLLLLLAVGIGPRTGAYQVRTVLTASMRPTIPEGSLVVVRPVRLSELRIDDVITYRIPAEDRRLVTHRIVEIKVAGDHPVVVTKGDANRSRDPWVAHLRGDRAWKAEMSVRKAGYALEMLRQPALRSATVLVARPSWLLCRWCRSGPPHQPLSPRRAVPRAGPRPPLKGVAGEEAPADVAAPTLETS